jgi:hypothetical protein
MQESHAAILLRLIECLRNCASQKEQQACGCIASAIPSTEEHRIDAYQPFFVHRV